MKIDLLKKSKGPAFHLSGSNTLHFANTWLAPSRDIALLSVTNYAGENLKAGTQATDEVIKNFLEID